MYAVEAQEGLEDPEHILTICKLAQQVLASLPLVLTSRIAAMSAGAVFPSAFCRTIVAALEIISLPCITQRSGGKAAQTKFHGQHGHPDLCEPWPHLRVLLTAAACLAEASVLPSKKRWRPCLTPAPKDRKDDSHGWILHPQP